jgi:hypothetical protein
MIIACYIRKPTLTPILITLDNHEQAAVAIIDEVIQRRFVDNPVDAWTTEVRHWIPTVLNNAIQAAGVNDASTITLDGTPIAVVRAEAVDIILDAGNRYLQRRGVVGELILVPGVSAGIKAVIDAAPHVAPVEV